MFIPIVLKRRLAMGCVGAMCALTPLLAPSASAQGDAYPPCSATVTDHCMQRGESDWHSGYGGRHHTHGEHHAHHRHHRH